MKITQKQSSSKELFIYIALAYTFGVLVRLVVLQDVWGVESIWYEGRILPIWNDDSGLYGYYAKQILAGMHYPFESDYILAYLIASIVYITGVHIDWVMLLLPAFLAPLVVIPIIIMGHWLNMTKFTFYASLMGVTGINYYTRSYLGYIDTDSINLFLSYLLVASFVVVIAKRDLRYAIISIVALVFLYHFYHSSKSLIAGILALNLLIVLIIYTKEKIAYQLLIITGVAFVLAIKLTISVALLLPIGLIGLAQSRSIEALDYRVYLGILGAMIVVALFVVDSSMLYARAMEYFKMAQLVSIGEYQITNVLATVNENKQHSIIDIFKGFVGTGFYVTMATIGYIALVVHKREFLFFLPLLLLGFLSFKIGIRFTMYAEFALALGFVYLLYYFKNEDWIDIGIAFGIVLMAYNILKVNKSLGPKYFVADDIKALKSLNLQPQDQLISWWDYGWSLWYYLGTQNTYIDNGLNTQGGTVFVAKMLFSSTPEQSYDLAKIIATHTRQLNILESQESIKIYANRVSLENKEVYIMLHRHMLRTFDTLANFADRDLRSGSLSQKRVFALSNIHKYAMRAESIIGENFTLNLKNGLLSDATNAKQLYGVVSFQNGKIQHFKRYNLKSNIMMILYGKQAIYLDTQSFKTIFLQGLILDRVGGKYFQKVLKSQNLYILKLNKQNFR